MRHIIIIITTKREIERVLTSGAINSADPTGLARSGSLATEDRRGGEEGTALLARSRSHNLTGDTRSASVHKIFSGLTSRWAIPAMGKEVNITYSILKHYL